MNLDDLQDSVDAWIKQHGGYYSELTNLARLTEEVGELARFYARREIPPKPDEDLTPDRFQEEFGDILFVLSCLANQAGFRLSDAAGRTIEKLNHRDSGRH